MWQKKGLIYNVDGEFDWNKSHAQVPVADVLAKRIRIYYATRNEKGQSNVSFIEVDKTEPQKILYQHNGALFELGSPGSFDDAGIMPSCIISVGDKKYMYYVGWSVRQTVPFQNAVGLAVSTDGGISFSKISMGPIITVNHVEPFFSGTSYVMHDNGIFKMWYLSCVGWELVGTKYEPLYNIKYAESDDMINWKQTGKVAIELDEHEGGLVSASVIKARGRYLMWFAKRGKYDYRQSGENSYRIGYAESDDGLRWTRKDELSGIELSDKGWDSEMIAYPYVVKAENSVFMFYNGNGFGKTGFGFATLQD